MCLSTLDHFIDIVLVVVIAFVLVGIATDDATVKSEQCPDCNNPESVECNIIWFCLICIPQCHSRFTSFTPITLQYLRYFLNILQNALLPLTQL